MNQKHIAIQFAKDYSEMQPHEKCTVWPPSGDGMLGLYTKPLQDIYDKWAKNNIPPKLPLSALAEDKETCEKIADLLGWKEEDFTVKYIEKHIKPKVYFWNESRSKQFNINIDGELALFDPADNEDDILKFQPIRHCRQICALLEKYEI